MEFKDYKAGQQFTCKMRGQVVEGKVQIEDSRVNQQFNRN